VADYHERRPKLHETRIYCFNVKKKPLPLVMAETDRVQMFFCTIEISVLRSFVVCY